MESGVPRTLVRIVGLAAAYWAGGRLGLLLALPPGYASAIWPPSGIALAALLLGGRRLWPGILLGSFALNLETSIRCAEGSRLLWPFLVTGLVGLGASIQAVVGERLIRRYAGDPLELVRERQILLFLLLGGPASCLISSTWGVGTLAAAGMMRAEQAAFSWWTWWIGDSLGVAVLTPLLLMAFAEPRAVWARRRLSVGVPLAAMAVLVAGAFLMARRWERENAHRDFAARAADLAQSLQVQIAEVEVTLSSLESFHAASQYIDREEFRAFAERSLRRRPSLHALSWNPRIAHGDREAFESGRIVDSGIPIRELSPGGDLVPAPVRAEYTPVKYIEPQNLNARALGFDVASDPARREAMHRACDLAAPNATAPLNLVQGPPATRSVLIFAPVFEGGQIPESVEDRRRRLVGYYVGLFNLEPLLAPVTWRARSAGMELSVWDEESMAPPAGPEDRPFQADFPIAAAGRTWRASFTGAETFQQERHALGPWTVLAGGTVLTALLGAFLLASTGRTIVIERLGVERAAELRASNEILRKQVEERRAAEAALRGKENELRQAQKMEVLGKLAAGVAHDFNNLLTPIIGYSDALAGALPDDDPRRAEIEEIRKSGERAAGLTRQLLAFSRKQVLQARVLDLNALVSDFQKLLRRVIGEDIVLSISPAPGLWPVKADPGQMEQVLLNLAVNARDAMPDGGRLTVKTSNLEAVKPDTGMEPGRYVVLEVSDTGIGMDAATLSQLFEPFFTTKPPGKGTGLGLATVYGIVKQSKGRIFVESEPGRGAAFRILLPAAAGEAPEAAPSAAPEPVVRGETILLVEDDPGVRNFSAGVLRGRGYQVLEVGTGVEAEARARSHPGPIDLLLTDVVMPGMSGPEVMRSVLALRPRVRGLFMSGYSMDAAALRGALGEGHPLLEKPFGASRLLQAVRQALECPVPIGPDPA